MISYKGLMRFMAASTVFIIWATWIATPVLIFIYIIVVEFIKYIFGLI